VNRITDRDEVLERLWQLGERGAATVELLRKSLKGRLSGDDLDRLQEDGMVRRDGEELSFTARGAARAERLIRTHRIGERLIHDVLGREFESAACEFEHILATEIVDGICTLLGHPRECPHGFAIPQGECCRVSARWVQKIVVPLTELQIGQTARVAWVYTRSDQQLHRLTSLQIRPGSIVKLHQDYPSYVIECDGASIAMDADVARSINVWLEGAAAVTDEAPPRHARPNFAKPWWRWRLGGRGRGN
jgi:DtxR family transcriptional regulator, Mn-dependent transcriptional regulator